MRNVRELSTLMILVVYWALSQTQATAYTSAIDRIEEDWELVIAAPSLEEAGPQISTTMSPVGDNEQSFVSFNLNYREFPFQAGGLQIQAWSGDEQVASPDVQHSASLNTTGEKITWTQRMWISGGSLNYAIVSGNSTTWGRFGQGDNLTLNYATGLSSLSSYSPTASVNHSGVSWQSNRVTSMRLLRVRYYSGNLLLGESSTPMSVTLSE